VKHFSEKIKVLDRLATGESASAVGRHYGINKSTVRSIKKNKKAIKSSVACSAPISAKMVSQVRDKTTEQMEKALNLWIEDQTQKKIPLSISIIRAKAKRLSEYFKWQRSGESLQSCDLQASKGWFDKCKNRHSLHNVKLAGESASVDHEVAQRFPEELRKLIEEKGYAPQQVFNADETVLFWEKNA
jgi:hypothetical protein